VFLRFEYITDAAVNGEGFFLDDVSWMRLATTPILRRMMAAGLGRICTGPKRSPQTFRLALIETKDSSVTMIPLNADQTAEIPISLARGEQIYLVISGTTRFTRELGTYQFEIRMII